jgi:O-antigen ligase
MVGVKRQKSPKVGFETVRTLEQFVPLVPPFCLIPLWIVSLATPNLIYSGVYWYETLHLMKWVAAAFPVVIAAIIAGVRLWIYPMDRVKIKVDGFAALMLVLLVYMGSQPLWADIWSVPSFVQEWLCFASMWGFYVITINSYPSYSARPMLWFANLNAAINVIFAELQIRGLNGFTSLILPTPGNYIGNTGQQNMFGLWMAICVLNSVYLYVAYAILPSGKKRSFFMTAANFVLMSVNAWGLWNSTSRSAILSLALALFFLVIMFLRTERIGQEKGYVRRIGVILFFLALVLTASILLNQSRAGSLIGKTVDMIENAGTVGGRSGIWATSYAMFKLRPFQGVGLGQYKWHYLEAQREMFDIYPENEWQYTHWAHNEYLQWFCEGGLAGGLLLLGLLGWWFISFLRALFSAAPLKLEGMWGNGLVLLISFNALWTRPFHRIENILWLCFGFALANREILRSGGLFNWPDTGALRNKLWGTLLLVVSVAGGWYLADGIYGDRMMRLALSTSDAALQSSSLMKARDHLMTRNESEKQMGYHFLSLSDYTRNAEDQLRGMGYLFSYFQKEPHSAEIQPLLNLAQIYERGDILQHILNLLKPGSYEYRFPAEPPSALN